MTSNSAGTYDDVRQTVTPHLIIKLLSVANLHDIIDSYNLQPYFALYLGESEVISAIGKEEGNRHTWEESVQVDLDGESPLYIVVQDKDEYGADTVLVRYRFDFGLFSQWRETARIRLRLQTSEEDEVIDTVVDKSVVLKGIGIEPAVELEFTYWDVERLGRLRAEIANHRNVVKNRQAFTQYEVWINRADGMKWRVDLRFSDFCVIRNELGKILRGVEDLPFPNKTYFDWLSRICTCASKFNEVRIAERKSILQNFLNVILDNLNEFSCDSVTNLLKLASPL